MNLKDSTTYRIMLTWMVALLGLFLLATCVQQPSNLTPVGGGSPLPTTMTTQPLMPTLNASTPPAWEMMKLTGISFDYPGGSVITSTTAPPDSQYGASVDIFDGDSFFQVGTSIGWELVADDTYPYNIPPNEGLWRYYFPTRVAVEGATKAWLFVIGIRHPETEEWLAVEGSELEPYASLDAVIYNEECDILIAIRTTFDLADTEQVEATSLDQVVAERYPIFDHMVRSVRFPDKCAGE